MKSALTHTISRARRREATAMLLDAAGSGFAAGAGVALIALVASRLAGHDLPWMVYPIIAAAGLLIGAVRAAFVLPAAFEIALQLDRTLRLRDRLASAYAIDAGVLASQRSAHRSSPSAAYDREFAALVREDGEQLAQKIDVRSLAPLRFNPAWGAGAVLSVLLFLGVLYVPVAAWGEGRAVEDPISAVERERAEEERQRLREEVEQIMEDLRADEELAHLPGAREELDALERLAEQLGEADPEQVRRAREETAARLNELADQLSEQARRDFEAAQRLAERFAGMDPPPERPMTAQEFDDALRRGDFGAAAEAIQERLDQLNELSEEERRELAQHLRETADQVDEIAAEEEAEFAERMAQMEQLLRDFGLDDDLLRDAMEGDGQAQREAMQRLQEMLADEEAAERLRRELERMREEREVQEQLQRDLEEMNEAMREAADEIDPSEDAPERAPDGVDPSEPDRLDADDVEREDDPQREGERETAEREADEPDDPGEPGEAERTREDEVEREEAREAAEQREAAQEGEEEGAREAIEEGEGPEQEGVAQEQEMEQPDDGAPQPGEGEAQEDQRRSPSDVMREMERRREQAERRQQAAERARQRARELADAPEQRDVQRELQRQLARDPSGEPGREAAEHAQREAERQREADAEDIDARIEDDDPGRVIAEWFSDEDLEADPDVRRAQIEERVRQAQRVAERAVEDAAVPPRYHEFIRRYFGRFNDRE